jgi:hypothetical protein
MDPDLYVSVHGQLSCHDCHDDINEKKLHLDPADVNKALKDFFQQQIVRRDRQSKNR